VAAEQVELLLAAQAELARTSVAAAVVLTHLEMVALAEQAIMAAAVAVVVLAVLDSHQALVERAAVPE
jgi:urease gamma subunit